MVQTKPTAGCLRACEFFDHEALSRHAAALVIEEIRRRPDLLLCTAAGSTPTRTYEILAAKGTTEPHLFDELRVLKLDEWGGLEPTHTATCESYLQKHLIRPLKLRARRIAQALRSRGDSGREHVKASHARVGEGSSHLRTDVGHGRDHAKQESPSVSQRRPQT